MPRKPQSDQEIQRGERLAHRLKKCRESHGLTQEDLAQASGVGLDTLRAIEGKKVCHPGVFTLADLASAMEVGLDDLVTGGARVRKGSRRQGEKK